jgi:hypothetical protein
MRTFATLGGPSDRPAVLRALPMFCDWPADALARLAAAAKINFAAPGEVLYRAGDSPDYLFVLRAGQIDLGSGGGESVATIDVLRPGEVFVLAAALLDRPDVITARAVTSSELLGSPGADRRRARAGEPGADAPVRRAEAGDGGGAPGPLSSEARAGAGPATRGESAVREAPVGLPARHHAGAPVARLCRTAPPRRQHLRPHSAPRGPPTRSPPSRGRTARTRRRAGWSSRLARPARTAGALPPRRVGARPVAARPPRRP